MPVYGQDLGSPYHRSRCPAHTTPPNLQDPATPRDSLSRIRGPIEYSTKLGKTKNQILRSLDCVITGVILGRMVAVAVGGGDGGVIGGKWACERGRGGEEGAKKNTPTEVAPSLSSAPLAAASRRWCRARGTSVPQKEGMRLQMTYASSCWMPGRSLPWACTRRRCM